MYLYGIGFKDLILKSTKGRVSVFIIDKIIIQIGSQHFWLWVVCIEPVNRSILGIHTSEERNRFVAENFIRSG